MNIANILARKGSMAVTVRPEQSIRDALALLDRHNIGALVAVEGDRPVGILSEDRKSTRLNSSHGYISYAVFCLKKKNPTAQPARHLCLPIALPNHSTRVST